MAEGWGLNVAFMRMLLIYMFNYFMSWFDFSLQTRQENLEEKIQELEERLKILDDPPSNKYIIEQAKQLNQDEGSAQNTLSGMWQLMKFNKRLQATEEAIDRVMTILNEFLGSDGKAISGLKSDMEDVANELRNLKESFLGYQTKPVDNNLEQRLLAGTLGKGDATSQLNSLEEKLDRFVTKDELSVYVKWPALEEALNVRKTDLEKRHRDKEDSNVVDVENSTYKASEPFDSENKASETESDGRLQTAPVQSTAHTPIATPDCEYAKTAFTRSTQV